MSPIQKFATDDVRIKEIKALRPPSDFLESLQDGIYFDGFVPRGCMAVKQKAHINWLGIFIVILLAILVKKIIKRIRKKKNKINV